MNKREIYPPLFMPDDDWQNNAKLNICHGLDLFAEGYKKAADVLVTYVKESEQDLDYLVYPIVFLYRHYLELIFKEIIQEGNQLLVGNNSIPHGHKLNDFWGQVKHIINVIWPNKAVDEFRHIDHIVNEFCAVDLRSDSFRYPVNKSGDNQLSHLSLLNVRHLSEEIDKAYEFLYGVSAYLEESNASYE